MSVVRVSKYRHVFGTPAKNEQCYTELRTNIPPFDSDCIKVNSQFFAVPWQGGGGSLAVLKHEQVGKQSSDIPCFTGHTGQVLDFDFNPFNDFLLASGSADCTVKLWQIPEGGLTQSTNDALLTMEGHQKKVGIVQFHPTANNVLFTAGVNDKGKFWDIETAKDQITLDADLQSVAFNRNGSLMAGYCRDKKLRIYDPRNNTVSSESDAHQGTKGARVNWLHNVNKIFTVGFTKIAERQFMIWDPRDMSKPLVTQDIDVASGLLMPFYDNESSVLFLAGKGDGNIRYYEIKDEEPYIYFLSEYKTNSPQRGMGALPKYAVDVNSCEIFRMYKLENNKVTPISFEVPRKSNLFQEDLFPDSLAPEAALTASEWFGGADAEPKTTSMKPGENKYKGVARSNTFKPSAEASAKAPEVKLPPKTNDPKQLLAQNEELRKRVEDLEKELHALKQQLNQ